MKKKLLSMMLCLCMLLTLFPVSALAAEENPFTDIKTSDWYYDEVQYVFENGLMKGVTDTIFDPAGMTSRGQIVTILYRLDGRPELSKENPFKDVGRGLYYEAPITWAAENAIVSGYSSDTFGPEDSITREQMASILYRYARYKGYDISKSADLTVFEDLNKLNSYAVKSMAWANGEGLITGFTATKLEPQGNAMRAQVASILYRFCERIVPEEVEEEHVHVWDAGTVTKEATDQEAGEYTYTCTGCGESVTAVLAQTQVQLNQAIEDREENIAVMDMTLSGDEFQLEVPEGVNLRMAGTTTVETEACLMITPESQGTIYIDNLVLVVGEESDEEILRGGAFINNGNVVLHDAWSGDGTYYGAAADEEGNVYEQVSCCFMYNVNKLTITGEVYVGTYGQLNNDGQMLITRSGKVTLADGERVEYGYYTIDENGKVILNQEDWNEERGDECWYDTYSKATITNWGQFDVNGALEIGRTSSLYNGNGNEVIENVILNVNGSVSVEGSLYNFQENTPINLAGTLTVKEGGDLGNDGLFHIEKNGTLLLGEYAHFGNNMTGEVVVDGTLELADGVYEGIVEYADEWGNAWGEYSNVSFLDNNGKFTVNGQMNVGVSSNVCNHEGAEMIINGKMTLENGEHQEWGYFTIAEDGKVEFTPGEFNEEWGGYYYEEESGKVYCYYDEWSNASFDNNGTVLVNGELSSSGFNNNAYTYEDENGLHIVEAQLTVADGGKVIVTGWMNNNSNWYEEDGETKWAAANILVEKGGNLNLETQLTGSAPYDEFFTAHIGNCASIVVDGKMTICRLASMNNWYNERWEDIDGESICLSTSPTELIINGELDMTDTEVLYEEIYDPDQDLTLKVPVDTCAPRLSSSGYIEVSGTLTEKASNFDSYGELVVGETGTIVFDSIWCDVDGDGYVDTYAGNDALIGSNTSVFGEIVINKRVVCNWNGDLKIIGGKLTIPTTGDLYIGDVALFSVTEDSEVVTNGGRILINDREGAIYDGDGNVVEWLGVVSKHIQDDFEGIDNVVRCVDVGSYEGMMAANAEDSGFDVCNLLEGEFVVNEDTFITTEINIYENARLVVEDGVTLVINSILYNYMGTNLELRGDANVEIVGDATGDDADHYYWGYSDGLNISEDKAQPIGSKYAYKITIVNAE